MDGGLEAVPGGQNGGGTMIEGLTIGGGGFAEGGGGGVVAGAAAGCLNEDLEARQILRRAIVAQVGDQPALGGFVIDGAQELAEALGAWVGVVEDIANGHAWKLGKLLELASA